MFNELLLTKGFNKNVHQINSIAMQSIIVATDFSETANNAFQYAIDAAKVVNGKIVLFHLYQISTHASHSLITAQGLDFLAHKKKDEVMQYAADMASLNGIEIEVAIRMGDFLDELEQVAAQYKSTILVLGMPKKSFEQDLLGNTTTAAIYKLRFPVLAIPESARFTSISRIMYACDLTRGIHTKVLEVVKEYAQMFKAEVLVFYVGEAIKKAETITGIDKALDGISYTYKNVFSESVVNAIQQEAESIKADILIMTPYKYGFWSSLLHRSKTRAMASNGKIPLLSLAY